MSLTGFDMTSMQKLFEHTVLATRPGFYGYMAAKWGLSSRPLPVSGAMNSALQTKGQVAAALEEVRRLRLPPCEDPEKNWDTLAALRAVLERTTRASRILDAGAETYSRILPWLYLYGYRQLVGNNLVFSRTAYRGPIRYQPGDLTRSGFDDASFDAVTCLSVIEHGVALEAYFGEMARILRPGGLLVTSTDYFETATDTRGLSAYGVPIRIFTKADLEAALQLAARFGLLLEKPVDFTCRDRVVRWAEHDLSYTFIVFALVKAR